MSRSLSAVVRRSRASRCCWTAVMVACLAPSGCTSLNLRGEGFPENGLSSLARKVRQADEQARSFAFSNKAREIYNDFPDR